jgi:hypothetical protein
MIYVNEFYYRAAILVLVKLGASKQTHNHWVDWHLHGKLVASCCSSAYTGPEYGTFYRIDKDVVKGWTSVITHSRRISGTEQHFLNKALRGDYDYKMLPSWISTLYDSAKKQNLHEASGMVYWNEEVRL